MVFKDKLSLGQRSNTEGYAAYSVLKAEIDHLARQRQNPADRGLTTAAAFCRQVGVRTHLRLIGGKSVLQDVLC